MNKYLKYSPEELAEDHRFIRFAQQQVDAEQWQQLMAEHPEMKPKVQLAIDIVTLLKTNEKSLPEEEVKHIWNAINAPSKSKHTRRLILRRACAVAAVLAVFLSVGIYLRSMNTDSSYQFSTAELASEEARLVLHDGKQIDLQRNNSTIAITGEQILVNDHALAEVSANEKNQKTALNEVIIPYGKRSELLLADGTKVWLNAGSRFAFPAEFTGKTREVYLQGEAYFDVAKCKGKGFVVNVDKLDIEVLGTKFNVSAYPDLEQVETVLIEGKVELSAENSLGMTLGSTSLSPMHKATFSKKERNIAVTEAPDADRYAAWVEGWLEFSQQSISSIFSQIERYYNVEISLSNSLQQEGKISGKLDLKESPEEVMKALSVVIDMDYRIEGNQINITLKKERRSR